MKYSHIIYNSSEKNQSGAVGFGVRSTSEGTPPELVSAMEENEIFSFAENGDPITPSALAANPNLILRIVPTYFFRQVSLPDRSKYFVLGRKIAVGFDYTFYLNGKPGRLGNYVVDAYAFPQAPSAREFEILLEDPQSGSNRFIPASPVPTADNFEMREISLGHNPTLPVSEKEFTTRARIVPGKQAVDLLFAFIQSRKEEKPVLVKSDVATPPRLMAELATLMPQNQIENLTFVTNHSDEGKKRGINIVFINEYYTFEIFKKQWVYLDLEANEMPQTPESALFRRSVEQYIERGDYDAIHKLVGWCLSPMYEKGKSFSKETQTQLYNYVYNYPQFNLRMLATDSNLRDTLVDYWATNPEEKKKFDGSLQNWFDSLENLPALWDWMEYVLAVSARNGRKGIDCTKALDANRRVITSAVFEDKGTFESFYRKFKDRFPMVQQFISTEAYTSAGHDAYLTAMLSDWETLYPYFLGDKVRDHVYLIERMIADKVPANTFNNVVRKEIKNQDAFIATLLKILEKRESATEYKIAKMLSENLQANNNAGIDFFTLFPDRLEDGYYTGLFTWQLRNSRPLNNNAIKTLADNLIKFQSNDTATAWALRPEGKNVFATLLRSLKDGLKNKTMTPHEVATICADIYSSNYYEDAQQFELLSIVANNADTAGDSRIASIWEIAKEVGDRKYLVDIFPHMASDMEKRDIKGLYSLCAFMLKNNLLTREKLTSHAKTSSNPDAFYVGILNWEELKPMEQYDYLFNECGKSDEEALDFLSKNFPESYEKVMKKRQPSIATKMFGAMKNLFAKKGNAEDTDSTEESGKAVSDDQKKGKAGKKDDSGRKGIFKK